MKYKYVRQPLQFKQKLQQPRLRWDRVNMEGNRIFRSWIVRLRSLALPSCFVQLNLPMGKEAVRTPPTPLPHKHTHTKSRLFSSANVCKC